MPFFHTKIAMPSSSRVVVDEGHRQDAGDENAEPVAVHLDLVALDHEAGLHGGVGDRQRSSARTQG